MKVWRYLMLSFGLLCACERAVPAPATDLLGGTALPNPSTSGAVPVYPSAAEDDPVAKADGLAITAAYDEIYGVTDPPQVPPVLLPEWATSDAVLIAWNELFDAYFETLVDALVDTAEVWIITQSEARSDAVRAQLGRVGILEDRLQFFEYAHEAFWTRDYGPWTVVMPSGTTAFVDTRYYPTRYRDDAVPTLLAAKFESDVFRPKLSAEGGNIMTNGSGLCVTTDRLSYNNPPMRTKAVSDVLATWLGCRQTVFLEALKGERTGHVDLFAKFTQPDTIVVGVYNVADDEENAARLDRNVERLSSIRLADGRALRILRMPMPRPRAPIFPTYTNALHINETLVVPRYEEHIELEVEVETVYRAALPAGTELKWVTSDGVIEVGGAVHCTTMQLKLGASDWLEVEGERPGPEALPDGAILRDGEILIPDGGTASDSIALYTGEEVSVGGVEVLVDVEHRVPESLIIRLFHGERLVQIEQTNSAAPMNRRRVLLEDFNGLPADGEWRLEIEDTETVFVGALNQWWLRVIPQN